MELQAFAICRGCFEVHVSARYCPHCQADGVAAEPALASSPAPSPGADELTPESAGSAGAGGVWLAGLAIAGLALVLLMAATAA